MRSLTPPRFAMPLYEYETVPETADDVAVRFVWQQAMTDPPLATHPVTHELVRRVISGGRGALMPQRSGAAVAAAFAAEAAASAPTPDQGSPAGGCGPGCGCSW